MAYNEPRKRKNGATTYDVRWQDKASGDRTHQKFDDESNAKLLLAVLRANDDNLQKAHKPVSERYAEKYTVSKMEFGRLMEAWKGEASDFTRY